jgi:hypothetical protein
VTSSWRSAAAPIIAAVIRQHGRADTKELRIALRDAYPFGERKMWPYKVWLSEIKRQRGQRERPLPHDSSQMDILSLPE